MSTAVDVPSAYGQFFVYRVPKANHDRFWDVEGKLETLFRTHGVVSSDFYVLEAGHVFQGFRDMREVLEATPDDEVWIEVDHYHDAADAVRVIAEIGKDPAAGPLFAEVLQLANPGVLSLQGNAGRMRGQSNPSAADTKTGFAE